MKDIVNLLQEPDLWALFATAGLTPVGAREVAALAEKLGYDRAQARKMLTEAVNRGLLTETTKGFNWVGVANHPKPDSYEGVALKYIQSHPFEADSSAIVVATKDSTARTRLCHLFNSLRAVRVQTEGPRVGYRYAAAIPMNWMELPVVARPVEVPEVPVAPPENKPVKKKPEVRRVASEKLPPRSIETAAKRVATPPPPPVRTKPASKRESSVPTTVEILATKPEPPRIEIREVIKEVPVVKEVQVEVPVYRDREVIKTVYQDREVKVEVVKEVGLVLTPEIETLITSVPEMEKELIRCLADTDSLIAAARKRDLLLQQIGRLVSQLALSKPTQQAVPVVSTAQPPVQPVQPPVQPVQPPVQPVQPPVQPVQPVRTVPLPVETAQPVPKPSEGALLAKSLIHLHGPNKFRKLVEGFILGTSNTELAIGMGPGVNRLQVQDWKKRLGTGSPFRLFPDIELPDSKEEVRTKKEERARATQEQVIASLPPYRFLRDEDAAARFFLAADRALELQDAWEEVFDHYGQRAILGYLVCMCRMAQEVMGGAQNLSTFQGRIFKALTQWSATVQPGFVYGLNSTHQPDPGATWFDMAQNHAQYLNLPVQAVVVGEAPTSTPRGFTMGNLIEALQDDLDGMILTAMVVDLNEKEGINQDHLVSVLAPVLHRIPRQPELKRLIKRIERFIDMRREAEEAAEEAAEVETTLPADWPGFIHTEGKKIVILGGDDRQAARERLQRELKAADIEWNPGDKMGGVDALIKRIHNQSVDLIICLLGYNSHSTFNKVVAACKTAKVQMATPRSYGLTAVSRAIENMAQQ